LPAFSAVFGIEKSFSIFSVHIEVVGFSVDKNDIEDIEYRIQHCRLPLLSALLLVRQGRR
jgi:hypothetical protein